MAVTMATGEVAKMLHYINPELSNDIERRQTQHLQQFLKDQHLYENEQEAMLREEILGQLDFVVKRWVKLVALAVGQPHSAAQEANAKIFTFGSYRLGVHAPGADIDTLCVGPNYAKRELHFFGDATYCLEQVLRTTPGVTEVISVPGAFVPVLKIKFRGIELDVLYANLAQFMIPEELDLTPNSVLRGCDEQSVRSLNGCRVTDTILKSVPDVGTFRLALKAIKLWAERRGVYSNVSGYLGGVNMALLVARTCRWYPKKCASGIVHHMFMMFTKVWTWPDALHLLEQKVENMGLGVWNPMLNERDARAIMPIITPCYPAMNSTYNVTRCTLAVMQEEFKRGLDVCNDILLTPCAVTPWGRLFEQLRFFEVLRAFYVMIEVYAGDPVELEKWDGWVRSRVRLLVRTLEDHTNVRPYPEALTSPPDLHPGDACPRKHYFLCLTKRAADAQQVNANGTIIPSQLPGGMQRNAGATAPQTGKVNVTQPLNTFKDQVMAWPERKESMVINFAVFRQGQLPNWVFPSGKNPLAPAKAAALPPAAAAAGAGGHGKAAEDSKVLAAAGGADSKAGTAAEGGAGGAEGARKRPAPEAAAGGQGGSQGGAAAAGAEPGQAGSEAPAAKRVKDDVQAVAGGEAVSGTAGASAAGPAASASIAGSSGSAATAAGAGAAAAGAADTAQASGAGAGASQGTGPAPSSASAGGSGPVKGAAAGGSGSAGGPVGGQGVLGKRARGAASREASELDLMGLDEEAMTSTDVVPMHASTPELQAAEADAKILAGGQEGVADWFGDSSRSMDCPPDQQQQVQGPGESSGGAAAAAGGSHVKEEGSVQQGGAAGSEQSGGQQPAGSQKQVAAGRGGAAGKPPPAKKPVFK